MIKIIKKILRPIYNIYIENRQLLLFKTALKENRGSKLRIVVGSSGLFEKGWIPSEYHFLNLLKDEDWSKYFEPNSIDTILAEHVWEHLNIADGLTAARTCFKYLRPGGRLRIAVPDGFHSDPKYIDYVRPGGSGAGASDHKVLYNYISFSEVLNNAGFKVDLLEYFDEKGSFHATNWLKEDGYIHRSIRYDQRNVNQSTTYTSLIIDAIKPV